MTNLVTFSDLANQPVEGFKPKPTRLTDEQVEASNHFGPLQTPGSKLDCGNAPLDDLPPIAVRRQSIVISYPDQPPSKT